MVLQPDLAETVVSAWNTNNRVTIFLIEHLPASLWTAKIPGAPRRSVRMIAGHLHNSRCMWIKTLGAAHGIPVPEPVNRYHVTSKQLIPSLALSSRGIVSLLKLGCQQGGTIPSNSAYRWRNLPLDVGHVLAYFVAHEGHHRGQIVMVARQLGLRLPPQVSGGLWQFSKRRREVEGESHAAGRPAP